MSQITGTIVLSKPGVIYPEQLNISLWTIDELKNVSKAKVLKNEVFKNLSFLIEFNINDLSPKATHFVEIEYAGLSIRTSSDTIDNLIKNLVTIELEKLYYYIDISVLVTNPRSTPLEGCNVKVFKVQVLSSTILAESVTGKDGKCGLTLKYSFAEIFKYADPVTYPVLKNPLNLQVFIESDKFISEVFYDVRNFLKCEAVVGAEENLGSPEFTIKSELFQNDSELSVLTPEQIRDAVGKSEYISKKLSIPVTEARHLMVSKHYAEVFKSDEEVVFALIKDNPDKDYKELLFRTNESLSAEVCDAVDSNLIYTDKVTVDAKVATLKTNLIATYLSEKEVSDKFDLIEGITTLIREEVVEATIDWKNNVELQNSGISLNDYLRDTGKYTPEQYQKAEVYDKVAQISENNIGLSVAVLSDSNLSWTNIDDIIAAKDSFESKINEYLNHLDESGNPDPLISLPDGIADAAGYQKHITKQLEKQYPSQFLKEEISKTGATLFAGTNIAEVIRTNKNFQFGEKTAWERMADPNFNTGTLDDAQRLQLRKDLQEAEQIFALTPEANKSLLAGVMKENDFTAPYKIAGLTRTAFIEQMSSLLPEDHEVSEEELSRIHAVSSYVTNQAALCMIETANANTQTVTSVIPNVSFNSTEASDGYPSVNELFGSQDYFEYPKCRTLFSQAAYLTDLLNFLRTSGKTTELFNRRPDLQNILLNCSNTDRVLPHIDLVNEILERAVLKLKGADTVDMYKLQTSWTNEELAAYPENLKITVNAYDDLKKAVAPWSLPFNLYLEEYRSYLKTLGLTREEIIKNFTSLSNNTLRNEALTDYLGLSTKEVECITVPLSDIEALDIYYPGISQVPGTGNVKQLIKLTGLSYDKIKDLLDSYFVNPVNDYGNRYFLYTIPGFLTERPDCLEEEEVENPGTLESTYIMNLDVYDLETQPLAQPSPNELFYDRLHRFERLRRKLDLKVYQLDLILQYLNCDTLNENDITKIAYFFKVKSQFNLKLEECLLFFNDFREGISYPGYVNLYDFIFLKNSENYKFKDSFKFLMGYIETNPNAVEFKFDNLQTILPYISGVKITEQQYVSIIENLGFTTELMLIPTLARLSKIFRVVYICKSLNISVDEYFFLTKITDLEIGEPQGFFTFTENVLKLKQYGFDISDLAYILKNENLEGNEVYKSEKDIITDLSELRDIIKPVDKDFYRKHVLESCAKVFDETIEQALDYIFNEIPEGNVTAVADFLIQHNDLFNNFSNYYEDEQNNHITLSDYFVNNRADTAKKLRSVLVGLGLETNLLSSPKRNISRAILKKNFLKIKTNILLQIIELKPFSVKFDERFDLNHNAASNLTVIRDTNIEKDSRPYTKSSNVSRSNAKNSKDMRSGLSGYKYSVSAQLTNLFNVASTCVTVNFPDTLTADVFIANNPGAFPAETDFLTETSLGDYSDINLRYIMYVSEMDHGVLEEKILDLKNLLPLFIDSDEIDKAIEIIINSQNNIHSDLANKTFIEDYFSSFVPKTEAVDSLWDIETEDYISNTCLRVDYVLDYLKQESRVDKIVSFFSQKFLCDEEIIVKLIFDYIQDSTNAPAIDSFCNIQFLNIPDFFTGNVTKQVSLYRIIYKACLFINEFKINSTMLERMWTIIKSDNEFFNILNIFNITGGSGTDLLKYLNLSTAVGLSHTYFADQTDFFTFFTDNPILSELTDDAKSFIIEISGCDENDFEVLNPDSPTSVHVLPDDLYINWFNALLKCRYIIKHLGANAKTIIDLNKTDSVIDFNQSEMLRQIVKNKYTEDEWYSISEALRNPLREKQRDALRDYLIIKNENFADTNDLFYYYLIDSEMTTLVKTSRITQATLSVQLFIQRVLMGLEGNLSFSTDDKNQLVWRKNYRVWEANRKILFFPENWLDPELRRNKSPFFKELEEKLLQNDIDDSTVLQAYYEYIDKLSEVSNLEILSVHRVGGLRPLDNNTLHMLGRTYGSPYKYYYRKLSNNNSWTPWEEVQNGIKGNIVQLCYWENELYMFWLETFITNEIPEKSISEYSLNEISGENPKYNAIRISWSKYKNNKWTPAITGDETYVEPQNAKTTNIALTVFPHTNEGKKYVELGISFDDNENHFASPYFLKKRGSFIFNGVEAFFDFKPAYENNSKIYASINKKTVINNKIKCEGENYPCFFLYYRDGLGDYSFPSSGKIYLFGGAPLGCKSYNIVYENIVRPNPDWYYANTSLNTWFKPFVLEDKINNKNFLAIPVINSDPIWNVKDDCSNLRYIIMTNYYSCVDDIKNALKYSGVNGLFSRSLHDKAPTEFKVEGQDFVSYYGHGGHVISHPQNIELLFGSNNEDSSNYVPTVCDPYANYNWELFYHIPLLIADNLSRNMKFEEAQKWYHKIFDPTVGDNSYTDAQGNFFPADTTAKKYWKIKPFREIFNNNYAPESVTDFVNELHKTNGAFTDLVEDWENDPFNPHKIAETRPVAYMKSVVVKYIENLLGWADMLFTKDTMEDVNQALLLYILAAEILGIKPQKLEGSLPEEKSFANMGNLDSISNSFDTVTGILTVIADHSSVSTEQTANFGAVDYQVSYFGIPHNSKMEEYWDVVGDRLFKIRHSMNIQGVLRELPLTAPPIDPGAVAAAMASGADLSSALSTLSAPMPLYRFNYMLQKAIEFTNDVKALGNTMLSVLEKKDAEDMALLRSTQEQIMLGAMTQIREKAIDEATENINSLNKSKDNVTSRKNYYGNKEKTNEKENKALERKAWSLGTRGLSGALSTTSGILAAIPQAEVSIPPAVIFGGVNLSMGLNAASTASSIAADIIQLAASNVEITSSYDRRYEDWQFQASQATGEINQIECQLAASKVRLAMSEKELENHLKQIEQKKEEYEFMKTKFTNKQLYNWMKGEVSKLYQSAFQMAHKLALAAEKAYLFERQKDNYRSFITSAYWDNLKEGLMAGELLYNDLRRLEMEYMETNSREMELSKDIPLSQINPQALIALQTTGTCNFDIPEMLYDIDHPGHYMRRIKAVSVSIPAVTGPYSGVTCKMSLLSNRFRKSTSASSPYNYQEPEDLRFIHNIIGIQSIATSTGNNDTGMFEFNFRDERYLPFEGAGAIGEWQIELPNTIRKFDYESISDVILHVKYTARDAGGTLKLAAEGNITNALNTLMEELGESDAVLSVVHSLKSEFADEVYELVNVPINTIGETTIEISKKHFPFIISDYVDRNPSKSIIINTITLVSKTNLSGNLFDSDVLIQVNEGGQEINKSWTQDPKNIELFNYTTAIPDCVNGKWVLTLNSDSYDGKDEVYLLISYSVTIP